MADEPVHDPSSPPHVPGYATQRLLGFGAAGEVWAATHEASGGQVALKMLARGRVDRATALHESALLRRIDHPHIVRLRDVVDVGPDLVLVLERAGGGSLAALVRARGPLDPGEVVSVLTPLAEALGYLHGRGLVHGDVAPTNVLFADDGRPLLADLGVASLVGLPGTIHATPGYEDPAARALGIATPAGDVHALACVGWFALTSRPPGPVELRQPLTYAAPGTPQALTELLTDALDPAPSHRPGVAAFAHRSSLAVAATPVRLVPTDPDAPSGEAVTHRIRVDARPDGPAHVAERPRWWRRPRTVLAVAGGTVLVAGVGAGLWWGLPGPSSAPTARPASSPSAAPPSAAPSSERPAPSSERPAPSSTDDLNSLRGLDAASAVAPLAALRAKAFATGDAAALTIAAAPGSPALADDQELLRDLADRGLVLAGLRFDVRKVEVLAIAATTARVRVDVVTAEHRQVDAAGDVVGRVEEGQPVISELDLALTDGAWQVARVVS